MYKLYNYLCRPVAVFPQVLLTQLLSARHPPFTPGSNLTVDVFIPSDQVWGWGGSCTAITVSRPQLSDLSSQNMAQGPEAGLWLAKQRAEASGRRPRAVM